MEGEEEEEGEEGVGDVEHGDHHGGGGCGVLLLCGKPGKRGGATLV